MFATQPIRRKLHFLIITKWSKLKRLIRIELILLAQLSQSCLLLIVVVVIADELIVFVNFLYFEFFFISNSTVPL